MVRIDWQRNSIKFLSVFLAIILWIYVSNEQNPTTDKEINVNLENSGLAQNYLITGGMPESVRVKVHGNKTQLANIAPGDFRALVSIPEGETGEVTVPVQVSSPPGLRVVQVYPNEVNVTIDSLVEKVIPVAVNLRGKPPQGYVAQTPLCQPSTVIARGPSKAVTEVSQATAVVDVQSATQDIELSLTVTTGNLSVSLNPSMVRVIVPITSSAIPKTVPVQPQLTGTPATGFAVARVVSDPAVVQVLGPPEATGAVTQIKTEPVDIRGIDKNLVKEVALIPVSGVANIYPNRVKVQVEVNKIEAQQQPPPSDGGTTPQKP
ncbi:MAG: YbbR-like protein [Pelotomaculum sp. PtaB.Bin013]|uniref:CdaR family protein n=1 Tax=Pelotomaculum isophthalicicum JI TaxID=947010 RepID=A0A9X4JW40_9FIRM|nr:CdaR family protein [Pelotomaculum isophthalicicum]MDF9408532.1 CdaR family protein [Pelotomaculum isophthalicicum JI]OPX84800.1 MAG: YbbR-like protein [Pelotomaculum sp. PtaB.Bin013]